MNPGLQILVVAIVGGIFAQWLSMRIKLPAIIPLLALGFFLGPEGPFSPDGTFGFYLMQRPSQVLSNETLGALISLGVVLILFEGGLSLNLKDYNLAPKTVRNLLSVGALVSFLGATLCARYIAGFEDWGICFIYGSLMIVTGPTVIVPLLKNVRVVRRVHSVLLWEGILIDAIGAIVAVVTLEVVLEDHGFFHATQGFLGALLFGPTVGFVGAWLLSKWLNWRKRNGLNDHELDRLLALGGAIAIYGFSESVFVESGLGAVTCAGLVMANMLKDDIEELRRFKGTLTTLLVSILFMLLAADFRFEHLAPLWPRGFYAIAALMLVVRPLNILACTKGSNLNWREKVFLGWISPRGIVAASVASLFAILLKADGQEEAGNQLIALTFSTIVVTCVLNGITIKPLAWILKLKVERPEGFLIVGANDLALRIAGVFENRGIPVMMVDTNPIMCARAREAGFSAVEGSALDHQFLSQQNMAGIGRLLAVTYNSDINARACIHTAKALDLTATYLQAATLSEMGYREQLEKTGAKLAFGRALDLNSLILQLRSGRSHMRSYRITTEGEPPEVDEKHHWLPIAVDLSGQLELFTEGCELPEGSDVIGLIFEDAPTA